MDNRKNTDSTRHDLDVMFRDRKPADPAGYTNQQSGGNEGAPGDDDAPWVKEPAFTTQTVPLVSELEVIISSAQGAEYQALPELQCQEYRLCEIYLEYVMAVGGRLSVIPEVRRSDGVWHAMTLIGGTVTPLAPVGSRFAAGGFGSRPLEGTELRTDVLAAGTARFAQTYDVAGALAFRLNVLDLTAHAGNTLSVYYALSM
jgi:hypothetical protein